MRATGRTVEFAKEIVAVSREEQATLLAAGIGYFALGSLVPLLLLLLVSVSAFERLDVALGLIEATTGPLNESVRTLVRDAVGSTASRRRAAVIAGALLLWNALRLVQGVKRVFSSVYGTREDESLEGMLTDTLVAFAAQVGGMSLIAVLGVGIATTMGGVVWVVLGPALAFVALVTVFFPMFYRFPAADVSTREALPGTLFAAGAWTLSGIGFRLYAEVSGSVRLYGLAGALLLVLTWLYVGGLVLVVGVVLNAVRAERVNPDESWLPTDYT